MDAIEQAYKQWQTIQLVSVIDNWGGILSLIFLYYLNYKTIFWITLALWIFSIANSAFKIYYLEGILGMRKQVRK